LILCQETRRAERLRVEEELRNLLGSLGPMP
jgi:hypothetical protein